MNLIADVYQKYGLEFDKHQLDSYKVKLTSILVIIALSLNRLIKGCYEKHLAFC